MRMSSWIIWVAPKFSKRHTRRGDTEERHTRRGVVKSETEMRVM